MHMESDGAPQQNSAMLPMAGALWLNQSRPYHSAYKALPTWPMYMHSYLPRPQAQQSSMQAEREELTMQRQELEARELEVERRTRALNLNAVRDDAPSVRSSQTPISQEQVSIKLKHASSQATSQRSLPLKQSLPSGIKVTSTVTTKTVRFPPASPQDGTDQDMKAMMQDMIRSSLTEYLVIPDASPTQSQSITLDKETPQVIDLSEGGLSNSEQEGPKSRLLNWTN